jgi:hypothetical protein
MSMEILLEGDGEVKNSSRFLERLSKRGCEYRIKLDVLTRGSGRGIVADGVERKWLNVKGAVSRKDWADHWS